LCEKGTTVVSFKRNNRHARKEQQLFHSKEKQRASEKGTTVVPFKKEEHRHEHVIDKVRMMKQNGSMEQKKVLIVIICPDSCFLDDFL
jgi:hypothetical protein